MADEQMYRLEYDFLEDGNVKHVSMGEIFTKTDLDSDLAVMDKSPESYRNIKWFAGRTRPVLTLEQVKALTEDKYWVWKFGPESRMTPEEVDAFWSDVPEEDQRFMPVPGSEIYVTDDGLIAMPPT